MLNSIFVVLVVVAVIAPISVKVRASNWDDANDEVVDASGCQRLVPRDDPDSVSMLWVACDVVYTGRSASRSIECWSCSCKCPAW